MRSDTKAERLKSRKVASVLAPSTARGGEEYFQNL